MIAPARAFARDINTAWRTMKASLREKAGRIYPACAPPDDRARKGVFLGQ
jgi:hypothetical protein